jgi:hypothetical protein
MEEPGEDNEFISVVQEVKLIPRNFGGNPKELREICECVETAIEVVHLTKHLLLLKFIESKITGEAKDRLVARSERYMGSDKRYLRGKLCCQENVRILRGRSI